MKTIHRVTRQLVAVVLTMGLIALAASAQAGTASVKVLRISKGGSARYSTDGKKTWQMLNVGDVLRSGAVIQTKEKTYVDLQMGEGEASAAVQQVSASGNGGTGAAAAGGSGNYDAEESGPSLVRVFESSILSIDKLTVEKTGTESVEETQLDLRAGQIMGNVKKLSAGSKYEVKIPNGVAGIRGTAYIISSSGKVTVISGSVVVAVVGADGQVTTRVVKAWETYDPVTQALNGIPPADRGRFIQLMTDMKPPILHGPTQYSLPPTQVFVTPIGPGDGNNQGGNNNNQGGNNNNQGGG